MPAEGFTRTAHFITALLEITDPTLARSVPQSHRTAFSNLPASHPAEVPCSLTSLLLLTEEQGSLTHAYMEGLETKEKEGSKTCAVQILPWLCVLARGMNDK